MGLEERAQRRLAELEAASLRRRPPTVDGPQAAQVVIEGRPLLSLCSNNYLGLADHPALVAAARASLEEEGLGSTASRLVCGTMRAHRDAEAALAGYLQLPDAVLFSTGYAANVGAVSAFAGKADVLFADALNHASLIDGTRLARAKVHVYRHGDLDHLRTLLRAHRHEGRTALVLTDTVFSMDGDEADLRALRSAADEADAALLLDEAHALGVLGPAGRGLAAELGVRAEVVTGGLGKAVGVSGGFVAGGSATMEVLRHDARSYVFSTAPTPGTARAAIAGLALVAAADAARARLAAHAARLREGLRDAGYRTVDGRTPIVPVVVGAADTAVALSGYLREQGFLVQAIRPPTVPRETSRLRLVPTAAHTTEDLERLLEAFRAAPTAYRGAP